MTEHPPDRAARPVVNADEVLADPETCVTFPERGAYQARLAPVGQILGTERIGINLTVVPPGKAAFPRHYHYVNDEAFVVRSGSGTLRYGEDLYPLRPMDVIHVPGGTGIPFQIRNTGPEELRYLGLSSLIPADVFHYVDADKIGVMANGAPFNNMNGTRITERLPRFARWIWPETNVGYWEGEPEAGDAGAVVTPRPGSSG